MKAKISVIVPVYNSENFIDRCVESLVNQTYKELEIILVDDCSKDGSLALCRKWQERDSRVKTVALESCLGAFMARMAGVEASAGDYISFVDCDDWLEYDALEYLYSLISSGNFDISAFHYQLTNDENPGKYDDGAEKLCEYKFNDMIKHYYDASLWSVWGKLFRKSLFELMPPLSISFCVSEDLVMNYHLFKNARALIASNKKKYYYFRHSLSAVAGNIHKKRITDSMAAYNMVLADMDESSPAYCYHIANMINNDFMLLNRIIIENRCLDCYDYVRAEILKYRKYIFKKENASCFGLKNKLMLLVLKFFPGLYNAVISKRG